MPIGAAKFAYQGYQATEGPARDAITISNLGDAEIDTAQSKFGGSCGYFNGSSSTDQRVQLLNATGTVGTGDYTVEMWYRAESIINAPNALTYIGGGLAMYITKSGNSGKLSYYRGSGTVGTTLLSTNTWHHLAFSRSNGTLRAFVNGSLEFTRTGETTSLSGTPNLACKNANDQDMDGWLDEYRISDVARYTTGFTPPTSAFENDEDTLCLIHFDGTDGSTTFVDDNS